MSLANYRKVSKGHEGIDPWSVTTFFDGEKWMKDYGDDNLEPVPVEEESEENK